MDLTNNHGGFLGTFLTKDGSKAIILAKAKMIIVATHRTEEIWCGYLLPNPESTFMLKSKKYNLGPIFSGIWDSKGNFIAQPGFEDWDLKNKVMERSV